MIQNSDIQMRDPFVFPNEHDGKYYLFGSTDKNIWGKGTGFDVYIGEDLEHWEGPFPVFRPDPDFFSEENFWAPEVHEYEGRFYMFATFLRKDNGHRGTAILVSGCLRGPFLPHSDGPITPKEWDSLDGTLHVNHDGQAWMVFCHEWVQTGDGEICAVRLSSDLRYAVGEPILLFKASDAMWPTSFVHRRFPERINYVTDGPFLVRMESGELLMLWASFVDHVYAQGISRSLSGQVDYKSDIVVPVETTQAVQENRENPISLQALGLLVNLLSYPTTWDLHKSELYKCYKKTKKIRLNLHGMT